MPTATARKTTPKSAATAPKPTNRFVHFQTGDGPLAGFFGFFLLAVFFVDVARSVAARRAPRLFLFERLSPRFDI